MSRVVAIALVAFAAHRGAREAHAEPRPDARAVAAAREANLEPESAREGFAIGIAVGPSLQLAYGVDKATGPGGGFDLRLGSVASARWVWLIEIAATAYPHDGTANQSAVLTFGGQLYLREALWLRAGGGFATFTRREARGAIPSEQFGGLGGIGAAGFDLVRRGGLALSAEGAGTLALYQEGTVLGFALQLGLSWY